MRSRLTELLDSGLVGHFRKTLEIRIDRRRPDLAGQVEIDGRLDQFCLVDGAGSHAQTLRAIGILAEQLRPAVGAKMFLHICTAIRHMLEDFRRTADLQRRFVDKQQGPIGRAGGGAAIAAMAIGDKLDVGVRGERDVSAQALSG